MTFSPNIDPNMHLPRFRRDLTLNEGPKDFDGAPTYTLYDPIRAHYFHLTWAEKQIYDCTRQNITLLSLITMLQKTTIKVSQEEILDFFQTAQQNRLLETPLSADSLMKESIIRKSQWWKLFLYKYLYFRIPLINPNSFLEKTRKYIKPLYSTLFLCFYAVAFIVSLYIVLTRFHEYTETFFYFFNMKGFAAYVIGILTVKFIHEFSHAYSASLLNIRVPAMGIAFIILWPVLYTDVTDSWKLQSRKQRFFISFAGVGSELVLASLSTIGWAMTQAGILNSMFFVVSSITWVSSLFMNLNPAMRFDGYYMFSDWIGVSNLQTRAFALTRWKLRKVFLGLEGEYPERRISPTKENILVIYSIYTWIYRLFLYTSIAVLVYLKFTKFIGIFLFSIEIVMFIGYPIIWEINNLIRLKALWNWNKRLITSLTAVAIFLGWAVIPWRHTEYFPAITVPVEEQVIYAPFDGEIDKIYVQRGDHVIIGDPIISISSVLLDAELARAQLDKMIQEQEFDKTISSENNQQFAIREIAQRIAYYQSQIQTIQEKKKLSQVTAEVAGSVYIYNDDLYPGQYIQENTTIAKITPLNRIKITAFIDEHFQPYIQSGSAVTFYFTQGKRKKIEGVINSIEPQRVFRLQYPQLASIHGGSIPVYHSKETNSYIIAGAYFTVDIHLTGETMQLPIGQPGEVAIKGPYQSKFVGWIRYLLQVLWRESSF